jgi:assimilatory nitrate reductase catalytic subunit
MSTVHTTCPYCGVGCGVVAAADGAAGTKTLGDAAHPANGGRLCSKGAALAKTLGDEGRLTEPLIGGSPASWDAALDLITRRFADAIAAHGPDSVAFYLSGQLLTEDYYVANKLMKGFIGSANIDTNSRLCMASTVAGHVRAFGEDIVPGVYEDLEQADLVLLVGSNTAWCHPVLHQRLQAARGVRGTKVVAIDPRVTATAEAADLHLPIASGTDVALFNFLLTAIADAGAVDHGWVEQNTNDFEAALAAAREDAPGLEQTAARCGIDPESLETLCDWFVRTERVVTVFSQGVNQARNGTDRVNAIINCHLATGRIGRPGAGPFSVTGQPNAMGGREVGGLANQLAAHLRFDWPGDRAALRDFWDAPRLAHRPGLKAVDLFQAVSEGRIKALWVAATNPAASMPHAGFVVEALRRCEFVVAADCWPTDTTALAHVVLPAAGWSEKDGTVTNSERCISRQRPFRPAPGLARPDWWMFCELARRLGHGAAFPYAGPAAIFREHAALSAHANGGRRVFDIGALATLGDADYDAMAPVRWPLPRGAASEGGRLFATGNFPTGDGRARFIPVREAIDEDAGTSRGFALNTGRVRDQWHTMTRTGRVPELMQHTPEPHVAINPTDAERLGLQEGSLARVASAHGEVVLPAVRTHAQRRGEIFVPMHWTRAFASAGPVGQAVQPDCDAVSGQPALKSTEVRITPVAARWHGILLRRQEGPAPVDAEWVRYPVAHGQVFRLTGLDEMPEGAELDAYATALLRAPGTQIVEMSDRSRKVFRRAALRDDGLEACVMFAASRAALPGEAALAALLGEAIPEGGRLRLLAGNLGGEPESRRICACFGVDEAAIRYAAVTHRLTNSAALGAHLRAGTNCGSCIPELERILRDVREPTG